MKTKVNYSNKKYNLLKILHTKYSKIEGERKKKEIIDRLNVSERTLMSWLYMPQDKQTEIRYSYLVKLAELLQTDVKQLINYEI